MAAENVQKVFRLTLFLAICCLIFIVSPRAQADTMTMCITDLNPTLNASCNAGDSVLLSSDGTTLTETKHGTATFGAGTSTGTDIIEFDGTVGAFTINFDAGQVDSASDNVLDLSFAAGTKSGTSGAHTLWIEFNADGFTSGAPFDGSAGGTLSKSGKDVFTGCFTGSGIWCTTSGTVLGSDSFTVNPFSGGFTSTTTAPSNPFGLGIELALTESGHASTTGDVNLIPTTVPEPSGIMLLGAGLFLLAALAKRKVVS
jgi:hypothetical protein